MTKKGNITKTPKKWIIKIIYWLEPTSTADRIGYFALIVASIFGLWGLRLTYKGMDTAVDIQHFDTLLTKTDSSLADQERLLNINSKLINLSQKQIDSLVSINKTLTKQFEVLSRQYSLSTTQESDIRKEKILERNSNWTHLYISYQLLSFGVQPYLHITFIDSSKEITALTKFSNILGSEIYNPILMENDSLSHEWMNVYNYIEIVKFELSTNPNRIDEYNGTTKITSSGKEVKENMVTEDFKSAMRKVASLSGKCFLYITQDRRRTKRLIR